MSIEHVKVGKFEIICYLLQATLSLYLGPLLQKEREKNKKKSPKLILEMYEHS